MNLNGPLRYHATIDHGVGAWFTTALLSAHTWGLRRRCTLSVVVPPCHTPRADRLINRTPSQPEQKQQPVQAPATKKPPRKLEMRLPNAGQSPTNITFSAPFLDNTLSKLLALQNRMLTVSNDIAASGDVDEKTKQEQFAQSAELSRIIALICAEKARQGA